jgi:hypothetical protein
MVPDTESSRERRVPTEAGSSESNDLAPFPALPLTGGGSWVQERRKKKVRTRYDGFEIFIAKRFTH